MNTIMSMFMSIMSWIEWCAWLVLSRFQWVSGEWRYTAREGGFLNVEQVLVVTASTGVSCGCHVDRPKLTDVERPSSVMSGSAAGDPLASGDRAARLSTAHSDIFILPPPPLPSLVVFRSRAVWRSSCFGWCWRRWLQTRKTHMPRLL